MQIARFVKSGSNKSLTFLLVCRNFSRKGKFKKFQTKISNQLESKTLTMKTELCTI